MLCCKTRDFHSRSLWFEVLVLCLCLSLQAGTVLQHLEHSSQQCSSLQTSSYRSQVGQNTLNGDEMHEKGWLDLWLLRRKNSPTVCLSLHSPIEQEKFRLPILKALSKLVPFFDLHGNTGKLFFKISVIWCHEIRYAVIMMLGSREQWKWVSPSV